MTPGDCAKRRVMAMAGDCPTVKEVVDVLRDDCGIMALTAYLILVDMTETHDIVIRLGCVMVDV